MLKFYHIICGLLLLLATGLLIGAGTMTGNGQMTSLQPVLYKIGYFGLLSVFVTSVLLSFGINRMQKYKTKDTHMTVSGPRTSPEPLKSILPSLYGMLSQNTTHR